MASPTRDVPKWLKRIQENSWEPEILLSGFVLIGLLQIPGYIDQYRAIAVPESLGGNFQGIFPGLKLAIYALVGGLIIHLFFRGVWVGYVGLSYAFPAGIRLGRLRYQPQFLRPIERIPTLQRQVEVLERVCSSMFATCFFMMMCVVGILLGVLVLISLLFGIDWLTSGYFFQWYERLFGPSFDGFVSFFVLIVAFDFISLGLLRKNRWIGMIYYPLHRFVGWITLSRFYRPIYYTFATNINRWILGILLLVFVALLIFGQALSVRAPDESVLSKVEFYVSDPRQAFFSGYYSDRNQSWESVRAVIPAPVVSSRFLELTIKHEVRHEKHMLTQCGLTDEQVQTRQPELMACVTQYYQVFIDGEQVNQPGWLSNFYQKEKRKGFVCFLDIDSLPPGKHLLEVRTRHPSDTFFAHIVFFKE